MCFVFLGGGAVAGEFGGRLEAAGAGCNTTSNDCPPDYHQTRALGTQVHLTPQGPSRELPPPPHRVKRANLLRYTHTLGPYDGFRTVGMLRVRSQM